MLRFTEIFIKGADSRFRACWVTVCPSPLGECHLWADPCLICSRSWSSNSPTPPPPPPQPWPPWQVHDKSVSARAGQVPLTHFPSIQVNFLSSPEARIDPVWLLLEFRMAPAFNNTVGSFPLYVRSADQVQAEISIPQRVPGGSDHKESACNAGDLDSIPGSGRFPGEGNGHPLQYSCLENSTDRGAWRATVQEVIKSWTDWATNTFTSHNVPGGDMGACGGVGPLTQAPPLPAQDLQALEQQLPHSQPQQLLRLGNARHLKFVFLFNWNWHFPKIGLLWNPEIAAWIVHKFISISPCSSYYKDWSAKEYGLSAFYFLFLLQSPFKIEEWCG